MVRANRRWFLALPVSALLILFFAAQIADAQATMTSPPPGSTLTGSTVTFIWSPGAGATAYWLDLGSTAGGNNYFQSGNLGNVLTVTVSGLPTDGSAVYATLWSNVNGQWIYNEYTYTAAGGSGALGAIVSPQPGSTLPGTNVTFTWSAGSGATAYWIDAGSSAGGNQYFQSGNLGNTLSAQVTGLPNNGSTVYVTLYSQINGQWLNNQHTYTAFNQSGSQGVLTTPNPGSMLPGSTVTFGWTAGSGATAYWLDLGSVAGGNQYFQSGNLGNVLTVTVNGLPTNGTTVYATLYSLVGGQWFPNSYSYTAATPVLAAMESPAPNSTIYGSQETFRWSAGSATAYWLDVGSTPGGNQYYQSGNLGDVLYTTVNSLPANNSTIYVTLYSYIGGQWLNNQYTYVSAPPVPATVVMSLVIDRSGSEVSDGGATALQAAVPQFVGYFTQGLDYLALVSFASSSSINVPITSTFMTPIDNAIQSMTFVGGTFGTGAGAGTNYSSTNGPPLSLADYQNNSVELPPGASEVKAVVYFTDGLMNTLQDQFSCTNISSSPTLINYGGFDAISGNNPQLVASFDPFMEEDGNVYCYESTQYAGSDPYYSECSNHVTLLDYTGANCTDNGQPVTTFPSQQFGEPMTISRQNVTAEAQWRAIYTANQMRSETPVPTYIYVIGLGNAVTENSCTEAFLATLANDPAAPSYSCPSDPGVYNSSLPPGLFLPVANCPSQQCTQELEQVFQVIASRLQ
jgi:hypothetical protein